MSIRCAIHQPNFFPWLGYFDKIRRSDVFVYLDRVNYPKSGSSMQSWCNRVQINVNGQPHWVFCPVVREHGAQVIDTVIIDSRRPWRDDLRKTLEINYKRARNFASAFDVIDELLCFETEKLAAFNINVIERLAPILGGAETRRVPQSALQLSGATATARLIEICRAVGADTYLCGGGSTAYQEDAAFGQAGVHLEYQNFRPTPYGDPARFLPGLSVIDWLMHRDV